MDSTDFFLTIIIFLIFIFLYVFNKLYIKYYEIKRNWPTYKCQPFIMPLAGYFGYDVGDNFVSCIGNIQSDLMGEFIKPLMGNLDNLSSYSNGLGNDLDNIIKMGENINSNQDDVFKSFIGLTENINNSLDLINEKSDNIDIGMESIINKQNQIVNELANCSVEAREAVGGG